MAEFLGTVIDFVNSTNVLQQVRAVDGKGLFSNAWFLVPFIAFVGYNLYRQEFNTLIMAALAVGIWLFTGSSYMSGLIVDGQLQLDKVLPVAGTFVVLIGVAVYFLFMRGD